MEITKLEMAVVEQVSQEVSDRETRELSDLQLALVGGGFADPIFA